MERRAEFHGRIRARFGADMVGRVLPFKIYYIPALLAGPVDTWRRLFDRVHAMGFAQVCLAPINASPGTGDIFLADDLDRADPRLGSDETADRLIARLAKMANGADLELLLDVVLDRVGAEGAAARNHPELYRPPPALSAVVDPRAPVSDGHAAFARFDDGEARVILGRQWSARLRAWHNSGAAGFRLLGLDRVPAEFVADLVRDVPQGRFLGWTPGLKWDRTTRLTGAGLAGVFASTPWWDARASWYVHEHGVLSHVAPIVAPVEAPFGPRLAQRTEAASAARRLLYRQALQLAATTSDGLLVPMGFEAMASMAMDARFPIAIEQNDDAALRDDIVAANALIDQWSARGAPSRLRTLTSPASRVTALELVGRETIVAINTDLLSPQPAPRVPQTDQAFAPGEVRMVDAKHQPAILGMNRSRESAVNAAISAPRIVIENLSPRVDGRVDGGPFAAKRIVGQEIRVEADAYMDGHDVLAAELLWKAADKDDWQRVPMVMAGNERWRASFTPDRIGRWHFTVEAWLDEYATLCRSARLKLDAGADVEVELAEMRLALEGAIARKSCTRSAVGKALDALGKGDTAASVQALTAPEVRQAVATPDARRFLARAEPLPVEVERREAGFASWYEFFPRSQTDDPARPATLVDVIDRLPRIRDMGFDILYFPPIHPIGRTARKGRNNSLNAGPQDVGSPYAIGSPEGGHDALDPALGTFEDFHRLVAAARDNGLEIALDFAIQCSPDHPWLKQHPDWFRRRPDGTIKYAENPPKKYEDIVNVDFYADGAMPALWQALRDVVLFWIDRGVKTFRVDNPHTKPLPFWQWMISDIRSRHPDAIFLSEAFTHPKMMYRLAKAGFSQSYTYFTWRNGKQELTDYLRELTTTEVAEFFRPNFFVNTPDINPVFLQNSGRPGFLIRAVLAATLSGLWGVYSGFELCEAAALPGREEYLDSEKYEIRVRDFAAPGNIGAEIATLNRIRRANPALQSHLGLAFYNSSNEHVLVYGKAAPEHDDMVFVIVNLDPHHAQETNFEIPLWEWRMPDNAALRAEDLMSGRTFTLHGKQQWLRLDPGVTPFAIWRLFPEGAA
jgi:starch synthase (maltosyl-transferring)